MDAVITPAEKKALKQAVKACFPGIRVSLIQDSRNGRQGCYRLHGRVYEQFSVECFLAFAKALDEVDVEVIGVMAGARYAEECGSFLVSFTVEPMEA